jgi:hypothetical protein
LRNQTTEAYYEYFQNQVNVVLHIGGSVGSDHPAMLARAAKEFGKKMEDLNETERQSAHKEFLAVAFINGTDHLRYGRLIEHLQNDYLQGVDGYPKNLVTAYNLLAHWQDS